MLVGREKLLTMLSIFCQTYHFSSQTDKIGKNLRAIYWCTQHG